MFTEWLEDVCSLVLVNPRTELVRVDVSRELKKKIELSFFFPRGNKIFEVEKELKQWIIDKKYPMTVTVDPGFYYLYVLYTGKNEWDTFERKLYNLSEIATLDFDDDNQLNLDRMIERRVDMNDYRLILRSEVNYRLRPKGDEYWKNYTKYLEKSLIDSGCIEEGDMMPSRLSKYDLWFTFFELNLKQYRIRSRYYGA